MVRYEVKIKIKDKNYTDDLILALVRQGYEVYFNNSIGSYDIDCDTLYFSVDDSEMCKLNDN